MKCVLEPRKRLIFPYKASSILIILENIKYALTFRQYRISFLLSILRDNSSREFLPGLVAKFRFDSVYYFQNVETIVCSHEFDLDFFEQG